MYPFSFGHCVVCPSSIYTSDYPFGIFKPLTTICELYSKKVSHSFSTMYLATECYSIVKICSIGVVDITLFPVMRKLCTSHNNSPSLGKNYRRWN